jgi:tetratricopeptide (TPR) repeat protein
VDSFTEANTEMGRVFDREKMYDSAEVYDKKALKLNPNHVLANNNLGSVYLATGRYAQAIVHYRTAVAKDPTFHLAYFNMARTYGQLKNPDSAIYFFKKTLETVPQSQEFAQEMLDCYQESGIAYYNKGDFANADVNFKQVLKMNPNDANAVNNLGAIYLNGKNYPQAIEMFKKAIALNPQYYNAYSNLGRAYYFTQQYDAALDMFNKELAINPKDGRDVPYMALSYKAKGDMTNALKYEAIAKTIYKDFKL